MKEILAYLKAKYEKLNESATLEEMKIKFKDKDVFTICETLIREGIIFEPRPGIVRYLG